MERTTAPEAPRSMLTRALINRDYALLWSGEAVSRVGDVVFDTTLILWIALQLAAGQSWAPLAVSGVLAAVSVPTVLLGPIAGVFADRWDKRHTMIWMDVLRAVLVGLLVPVAVLGDSLPIGARLAAIYAIVALATVCAQFFDPCRMALIGDIVTPEERPRASALGQVTMNMAGIVGPPLAPILFVAFGAGWALAINAASFLVSMAAIMAIRARTPEALPEHHPAPHFWREFGEGLRFFRGNAVLTTVLISGIIITLGAGTLNVLDVFFVTHNLHASAAAYGWISAAFAGGGLAGGIVMSVVGNRIPPARAFWLGLALGGVAMVLYSRMTAAVPAAVVLIVAGLVISGVNTSIMPLVLQATPREMLGRVSGVLNPAFNLAGIISMVLSAVLVSTVMRGLHADLLGQVFTPVDTLFAFAGLVAVLSGLYAMRRLSRDADVQAPSETETRTARAV